MLIKTLGLLLLVTGQSLGDLIHLGIPNIYFGGGGSGSHPGPSSSSHHNHQGQSDREAYLNAYYSDHWQQFYQAQAAYYAYWPYGPYGGYPPYGPPPPPPPPTTEAPETSTPETSTGTPTTPTTSTAIPTSTGDPTTSTAVASQTQPIRLWLRTTPLPFHYVPKDVIGPNRSQLPISDHISEEGGPHDDQQGPYPQFVGKK